MFDPVDEEYYEMLHSLPAKYKDEQISFVYIFPDEPGYQMRDSHFDGAIAVIYKSKRLKYRKIDSFENLDSVVSDALGGGGKWLKADPL